MLLTNKKVQSLLNLLELKELDGLTIKLSRTEDEGDKEIYIFFKYGFAEYVIGINDSGYEGELIAFRFSYSREYSEKIREENEGIHANIHVSINSSLKDSNKAVIECELYESEEALENEEKPIEVINKEIEHSKDILDIADFLTKEFNFK